MLRFGKKKPLPPAVLPRHIGIIMDGNGRWAKKRGLPRRAGHAAGARTFRTIAKYCEQRGIPCLTVYAFSTENWRRPPEEVEALMNLLRDYLKESLSDFRQENIRVRFLGDRKPLADDLQKLMAEAKEATAKKTGMQLNIAVNYGGREEIVHSLRELAGEVAAGRLTPEELSEQLVEAHLYTAGQPELDLILRPSGEYRLSNFLLWQSAYAEYIFMDVLWPDFTPAHLEQALTEYAGRHRRFGGV